MPSEKVVHLQQNHNFNRIQHFSNRQYTS